MADIATVELWLLDSVYKLGCPIHRQDDLRHAGEMLEQKFRDMRSANPRMDNQKIAVMVSLQMMQEILELNKSLQHYTQCERVIADMVENLDQQVNHVLNRTKSDHSS